MDTNTLSDLIRNPSGALIPRLSSIEPGAVRTSIVVGCELRFGAKRKGSKTLTDRVEQLLASLTVLPLDEPADQHYGTFGTRWSGRAHPFATTICSSLRMPARAT